MPHQDEDAYQQMRGQYHWLNGKDTFLFGIKLKDWAIIAGGIAFAAGTWYGLQNITRAVGKLEAKIETTRVERNAELRELQVRVAKGEAEDARQAEQLKNLTDVVKDVRDLLRDAAKAR